MDYLKFECPHCKCKLEVLKYMLGQRIKCPKCDKWIRFTEPKPIFNYKTASINSLNNEFELIAEESGGYQLKDREVNYLLRVLQNGEELFFFTKAKYAITINEFLLTKLKLMSEEKLANIDTCLILLTNKRIIFLYEDMFCGFKHKNVLLNRIDEVSKFGRLVYFENNYNNILILLFEPGDISEIFLKKCKAVLYSIDPKKYPVSKEFVRKYSSVSSFVRGCLLVVILILFFVFWLFLVNSSSTKNNETSSFTSNSPSQQKVEKVKKAKGSSSSEQSSKINAENKLQSDTSDTSCNLYTMYYTNNSNKTNIPSLPKKPDWKKRKDFWRTLSRGSFYPPKLGSYGKIKLINGEIQHGVLIKLTNRIVKIRINNHVTVSYKRNQLAPRSRRVFFEEDFLEYNANLMVNEEKEIYKQKLAQFDINNRSYEENSYEVSNSENVQ